MSLTMQHAINQIVEELSPEECKRLSYLCREFHSERCTTNIKEMLQSCIDQGKNPQPFLIELMLRMRRYDLLYNVLGIRRKDAELFLENGRAVSEYRVLMADLSEDFGSDDLSSLIFLLRGTLPKEKVEKCECFLDVVVELEKLDQISSTRMEVMEKYLIAIHRVDLAKRLSQYQNKAGTRSPATVKPRDERQSQCRAATNCKPAHTNSIPLPPISPLTHTSAAFPPELGCTRKPTTACINTKELPCLSPRRPREWQEDVYRMHCKPRGLCLIIDCVGNEGAHLEQLFSKLHFRVIHHMLLSVRDIRSCLYHISRQTEHSKMDAFVCCIISRSCSSQLLGTDLYTPGIDLNDVRQFFAPESCPGLTGKPKLFFIQSYETSESSNVIGFTDYQDGELETDSPFQYRFRREVVPEDADVFWSHCWTNDKQLEENSHHSVYLQSLKEALLDGQKRRIHLVDLHMAVNRAVYAHNSSQPGLTYHINLRHTLRKSAYLT
ncbi:CASP8 and FADD-like apoptosis regulator isoform X1 [Tachysurus fulvidraco]|uniref:CASP8 and FADD-like apoptosis regulator isoform X1 n=1 Tax=Tachysurus fulvidraco TaxID=1234273 RepID=UPI000F4DDB53|nr:CASP8 and FADD-like apoptosis regulator isoform X1 [Tachysurus fulvidraco]